MFEPDEASFTAQAQEVAREQASYLAIPFWIWNEDTMVPAKNKLLVFDPYGRVLAQTELFGAADRTMVAQVPVEDVPTL